MNDRELLELAARAIGLRFHAYVDNEFFGRGINTGELDVPLWNPLDDDGDALRLAVRLFIQVRPEPHGRCNVQTLDGWMRTEAGYESTEAATRRAIVRAAAEIGRAAPAHPGEGEKPCS